MYFRAWHRTYQMALLFCIPMMSDKRDRYNTPHFPSACILHIGHTCLHKLFLHIQVQLSMRLEIKNSYLFLLWKTYCTSTILRNKIKRTCSTLSFMFDSQRRVITPLCKIEPTTVSISFTIWPTNGCVHLNAISVSGSTTWKI